MATYTLLDPSELETIVTDYGLGKLGASDAAPEAAFTPNYVLNTSKGRFVLKLEEVKSELEVKREIDLLLFLRKHGYPCPQPVPDRKGRYYRDFGGKWLSLYKRIEGQYRSADEISVEQLENVGRLLGELHIVGKGYKKGIENRFSFDRVFELYKDIRPKLPSYFRRIVRTLDDEVDYLRNYLEPKLPKGVIHGDLFPDHVLFKGDKVAGIVDFAVACRGKFVFDLATTVNALCFEEGSYELKRFEALIAGYESMRTLSLAEWDAFPNELRFSALRFTITRLKDFFLTTGSRRHGRLRGNKDFEEFYDRLKVLRREKDGGMEGILMAMATGYDYRKYQKVKAVEKKGR